MGFASIVAKMHLPLWLLWPLALICEFLGRLTGRTMKLNTFNVWVLTVNRWFRIDAAVKDLGYAPVVAFSDGWPDTLTWFRAHWLPTYQRPNWAAIFGLARSTQKKIDIQASGTRTGVDSQRSASR